MCRDMLYEILDDGMNGVVGSLDEKIVGEYNCFFGVVRVSSYSFNCFVCDFFDYGFGVNVDFFFFEGVFGVFDELFGEVREDVGESFD